MRGFFTGRTSGVAKSLLVLGCIGAVAGLYVASATSAPSNRMLKATFAPATVAGGTFGATLTLQICNTGSSQLGSVNVTAPAGFSIQPGGVSPLPGSGSSSTATSILLRNLSLNGGQCTPSMNVVVDVPCPDGSYQWAVEGRSQGNFTGQSFALDPASNPVTQVAKACTLVITVQPASAETAPDIITDVPYNDPAPGNAVTVEAHNGADVLVPSADEDVTLDVTGTFTSPGAFSGLTEPLSGGTASFGNMTSTATGTDFVLTATATGYFGSDPSDVFAIVLDGRKCPGGGASCHVETPPGHTFASLDSSGTSELDTSGIALLHFDVFDVPVGVCDALDGTPWSPIQESQGFSMSVTVAAGEQPDYTIKVIFDKFVVQFIPNNGNQLGACFGAQRLDINGAAIPCLADLDGGFPTANNPDPLNDPFHAKCDMATQMWWGLLPDAGPGINVCSDPALTDPVVLSRKRNFKPGGFVGTLCKPYPWDEKGAWG